MECCRCIAGHAMAFIWLMTQLIWGGKNFEKIRRICVLTTYIVGATGLGGRDHCFDIWVNSDLRGCKKKATNPFSVMFMVVYIIKNSFNLIKVTGAMKDLPQKPNNYNNAEFQYFAPYEVRVNGTLRKSALKSGLLWRTAGGLALLTERTWKLEPWRRYGCPFHVTSRLFWVQI